MRDLLMISVIIPIKYGDNERSRLSEIGLMWNWFSRMSSKKVKCHVKEAKNMNSNSEWMLNRDWVVPRYYLEVGPTLIILEIL